MQKAKTYGSKLVHISTDTVVLEGNLAIPQKASGVVIFAHGSGSGRFSPRNKFVAYRLNENHIATLLVDLLTDAEEKEDEETRALRFNIDLLASRLMYATHFCQLNEKLKNLDIGYFGASTGAAAALVAASVYPEPVKAIVSRGGRPDLAGDALKNIVVPTLLIVGGNDYEVIDLNRKALSKLTKVKDKKLVIISGATHLFEEPGTLEQVADHASKWFKKYL